MRLADIFSGAIPGGVYRYGSRTAPDTLSQRAGAVGWRCFYLTGAEIGGKAALLDAIGRAAGFPAYCGHNWDALEECLRDLSWMPARGYVLLWDDDQVLAHADRAAYQTAVSILESAAEEWAAQGVPFVALLRG